MPLFVRPLFGNSNLKLTQTPRAVTPFGGLVSLVRFLEKIGFTTQLTAHMPWSLNSPNAIAPEHTLTSFMMGVVMGARRFAHTEIARADRALHVLLGLKRWPGADTVRNFFHRFTPSAIQSFWRPLWSWLLTMIVCPPQGFSLDLDSTVFQRSGRQQGAAKGYNPRRPGRKTHHPLLAVLAEASFVLHAWLRSGNTGAATGVKEFLIETLAQLPAHIKIRSVRADSGFFDQKLLAFFEEKQLSYIVVARMTCTLKRRAAAIKDWQSIDDNYAVGSFDFQLPGWTTSRRFVAIRERIREGKGAVGRKLIDVPGYTFRIWVTNRNESPMDVWRDYNGRATVEQRIEELKNDLGADDFCTQNFWATESAFLAVVFTFNLLNLYQQSIAPNAPMKRPATLRVATFICGAILGRQGRHHVLHLSASWGGLEKHNLLLEAVLKWQIPTSPKLNLTPDPATS